MNVSRETNLIRFPQERRTAAVDDCKPAVILIMPVVRVERLDLHHPLAPLLDAGPRQRCVEAFDALNEAFRNLPI